jgi:hypothetical protein
MKNILIILFLLLVSSVIYSGTGGEHPEDFELTYYMKDTVSGSNLFMEIKKGKLKVDYINGVRKISKRKYYEIDDEDIDKLYNYMVTEKFLDWESPEKTITQNMAAQYISGGYNGRENIMIFSAAGDPPMDLLKLKYKFFEITDKYDRFWKRDMRDILKVEEK